jgi:hypothetical protein
MFTPQGTDGQRFSLSLSLSLGLGLRKKGDEETERR